jgi:hypothetical protein
MRSLDAKAVQEREIQFPVLLRVTEQEVDLSGLSGRQKDFYSRLIDSRDVQRP